MRIMKHARTGNIGINIKDGVVEIFHTTINSPARITFSEKDFNQALEMLGYKNA